MPRSRKRAKKSSKMDKLTPSQEMALDIVEHNLPVFKEDTRTIKEIEEWFETDSEAPILYFSGVELTKDSVIFTPFTAASVNARRIEAEIRKRGVAEGHELWEETYQRTTEVCQVAIEQIVQGVLRGC